MSSTESSSTSGNPAGADGEVAVGLRVQGASKAQIDQMTHELQVLLRQETEEDDMTLERRKDDPNSQDAGALLIAVLAAPAVVEATKGAGRALTELAKGIAKFIARWNLEVEVSADGTAKVAERPDEVERILLELLRQRLNERKGL